MARIVFECVPLVWRKGTARTAKVKLTKNPRMHRSRQVLRKKAKVSTWCFLHLSSCHNRRSGGSSAPGDLGGKGSGTLDFIDYHVSALNLEIAGTPWQRESSGDHRPLIARNCTACSQLFWTGLNSLGWPGKTVLLSYLFIAFLFNRAICLTKSCGAA